MGGTADLQRRSGAAHAGGCGFLYLAHLEKKVEQRAAARKAKDFAEADRLRDAIAALGWSVRETRQGVEIKKL